MANPAGALEPKDVVLTLLGVSAGLAGLVLVFLGLVVTTYQSFERPTPHPILARYKRIIALVLAAFAIGLTCVVLSTIWMIGSGHGQGIYAAVVASFFAQIVALAVATGWTVRKLVWGS